MRGLVGIVMVLLMVFGGYVWAGGSLGIIVSALPYELTMIGGAAIGAFVIANDMDAIKQTGRDIAKIFRGPRWSPEDYRDLLCLLFELVRLSRQNPALLERHIESPDDSSVFARYPRVLADREAVEMICDTLRAASMNYDDPHQVEEILEKRMESAHHHAQRTSRALQITADALPALGIIAAVLGVIKTMAAIDQPPEILGGMIGGALVGTFLGVFLSYGFVGPFAARMRQVIDEEHQFHHLIREVLVANMHEHAAGICIEVGRQNTPPPLRPSFDAIEDALRDIKREAA